MDERAEAEAQAERMGTPESLPDLESITSSSSDGQRDIETDEQRWARERNPPPRNLGLFPWENTNFNLHEFFNFVSRWADHYAETHDGAHPLDDMYLQNPTDLVRRSPTPCRPPSGSPPLEQRRQDAAWELARRAASYAASHLSERNALRELASSEQH